MKATRGILFGLRGLLCSMGYRNVDFLRSYPRKKVDGLKAKGFEVATASELFETEFGKVVRLVPIESIC